MFGVNKDGAAQSGFGVLDTESWAWSEEYLSSYSGGDDSSGSDSGGSNGNGSSSNSLSSGAIAGVVVGCVAGVVTYYSFSLCNLKKKQT